MQIGSENHVRENATKDDEKVSPRPPKWPPKWIKNPPRGAKMRSTFGQKIACLLNWLPGGPKDVKIS